MDGLGTAACRGPELSDLAPSVANVTMTTAGSLDDLALHDVTFCVVDLETTGGSAAAGAMITEIGAVKVRGGEVLGEFHTLVDPEIGIPPFITVLTGIDDVLVYGAPTIDSVLPSFLEFSAGAVLVAHNAPFDLGFLRHFADQLGYDWPECESVDTVTLARRTLTTDDTPNCKLATLARALGATTTPVHRALDDARATVDVLHSLLERLGRRVTTFDDLRAHLGTPSIHKKPKLIDVA